MSKEDLIPLNKRTIEEQKEITRKAGIASGKARRERKTIADALKKILDEPLQKGSKQSKLDGIAIKAIKKIFDDPDIKDIKTLSEILGEMKTTIDAKGLNINIQTSEEGRSNIEQILDGK